MTGNDLWSDMQKRPQFAHGYIYGVTESLINLPNFCVQKDVTYGQVSDMTYALLRDNPQIRQKQGIVIIGELIKNNFPCGK